MTKSTNNQNLTALTITGFPKFCDLLVERFYTSIEHYCEVNYFTIFVSLVDHSREGIIEGQRIVLAGYLTIGAILYFMLNLMTTDWRGTSQNGAELPGVTYYYVLRLNLGDGDIIRGNVLIVR